MSQEVLRSFEQLYYWVSMFYVWGGEYTRVADEARVELRRLYRETYRHDEEGA